MRLKKALDKLEASAAYYLILEDKLHRRIRVKGFPYFCICIEGSLVIVKILFPQKDHPAKLWTLFNNLY